MPEGFPPGGGGGRSTGVPGVPGSTGGCAWSGNGGCTGETISLGGLPWPTPEGGAATGGTPSGSPGGDGGAPTGGEPVPAPSGGAPTGLSPALPVTSAEGGTETGGLPWLAPALLVTSLLPTLAEPRPAQSTGRLSGPWPCAWAGRSPRLVAALQAASRTAAPRPWPASLAAMASLTAEDVASPWAAGAAGSSSPCA